MKDKDFKKFEKVFEKRLSQNLDSEILKRLKKGESLIDEDLKTTDYELFREENTPQAYNFYEKICHYSEKILNVKPDKKSAEIIKNNLNEAHIEATPTGAMSASILISLILLFIGIGLFIPESLSNFGVGIIIVAIFSYFFLQKIPSLLRDIHRAKASDQIIVAVFYIVSFMRFNPNLELATTFAAKYVGAPLSLDFKRILWDLENQKYPNIKIAFDEYLKNWKDTNLEFLEAIYLIESSLYESEDFRRIGMLDKALDIILQGNYEKMLHFAQELKGKVNVFNMLGVVLPIMGLIILPLAASFGDPKGVWQVTVILYSILIPFILVFYGSTIAIGKPGGVNSIRVVKLKNFKQLTAVPIKVSKKKTFYLSPIYYSLMVFGMLLLLGLSPLIIYSAYPALSDQLNELNLPLAEITQGNIILFKELESNGNIYTFGPYGFYPGIMSLFIPAAFGLAFGYYFFYKYKNLIKYRDKTKKLERQFPTASFQLGNRISEGISVELAFGMVAETMRGTEAGIFFGQIDKNIKFNGMSINKAIFDPERGAIKDYPSDIITSSLKIMVKSVEQGPEITAKTLVDLSKYLTELHMSHERLIDLLSESLSSMKGQKSFLAPLITGIVVSIVYLVTSIMGSLKSSISNISMDSGSVSGIADAGNILGDSIPTYLFQIPVGVYLMSLIAILVVVITNLENGDDPVLKKYEIGASLISAVKKYVIVTMIGMIIFAIVGKSFMSSM